MAKEWVPLDLGGIRDITEAQVGITGYNQYPFEDIKVRETYTWEDYNSTKYGSHQALELQNKVFGTSGAATYRAAKDYRIKMLIYSENYDYFPDEVKSGMSDKLIEIKNALGDSFIVFWLDGSTDDYVSCDIDGEHSGIGNFSLRLGGDFVFKGSPKMNNECKFVVLETEYYQEVGELEPTDEERQQDAIDNRNEDPDFNPDIDFNPPEDGGDLDSSDEDDRSILWLVAIGAVVLVAIGFLAIPRRREE